MFGLTGTAAARQQPGAPEEHPELTPAGMRNEGFGTLVEPETVGSVNVRLITHVPLGSPFTVADIEIEQELSRPYAYVSRMNGTDGSAGVTIISLKDPAAARVLHTWRYDGASALRGMGGTDCKYFKLDGRYYVVQSLRWNPAGTDADAGAVVLDVTSLPDTRTVREVARIRYVESPGGFENVFAYRHSDGRVLLFAATNTGHANIYDMRKVLSGAPDALAGTVPLPDRAVGARYHDMHVAFHVDTQQDRFYGAGTGGYFIYDVTRIAAPKLITTVTALGVPAGGAFVPTPDGHFGIGQTEYQYAPLRMFDLRTGNSSAEVKRPVGGWTANWENVSHSMEMRWPYVFVASYEDGLQILNMRDPSRPRAVGFYHTFDGPHNRGWGGVDAPLSGNNVFNGAYGVDVRNADGLVVVSDMQSGFWAFKLDGFNGWNGTTWGMPNISSVQDWDAGPAGLIRKPVL
jgi:hypothetical protein